MAKFKVQLFQASSEVAGKAALGVFEVSKNEQVTEVMVEAPDEESAKRLVTLLTAGRRQSAFQHI